MLRFALAVLAVLAAIPLRAPALRAQDSTAASSAAASPSDARPADTLPAAWWEHGELVMELDGSWMAWYTGGAGVSGGDRRRFAKALGAPELAETSRDVAVFDWLGRRGWMLVGCDTGIEHLSGLFSGKGPVRHCWFRRERRR